VRERILVRTGDRTVLSEPWKLFLLSVPLVLFVAAFSYAPLFGWVYAFFNYKPGTPLSAAQFVGLRYFLRVFSEWGELLRVLRNSLAMSFLGLLGSPLPILFALLLNELRWRGLRKAAQTVTTLPNFISWIIVYSIAFALFSTDGLANALRLRLGLEPAARSILGDPSRTWIFQWALGTWKSLGWSAIIYLAAIASIDEELFDAARIDGAGRAQTILHVTLPGIVPTYFVMLLLQISNLLNNGFDQYFVFSNPLVAERIEVLDYYVYKIAILTGDYPLSIALGMYKTLIGVILLFGANAVSRRVRGRSIV
jgi:putative aldouronate transport system permease protein